MQSHLQSSPGVNHQHLRCIPCCGRPAKLPAVHEAVRRLPLQYFILHGAAGQLQPLKAARPQAAPAVAAGIQVAPGNLRVPCKHSGSRRRCCLTSTVEQTYKC